MTLVANLTCLISLFSNLENVEKYNLCRELQEESGLLVKSSNLIKFAVIEFEFVGDPVILEVHAFQTHSFEGEPIETEGKQFQNRNLFNVTELI